MDSAGGGFSEKRLDLRERQLNWIEVGAVGRQEKHARAGGLNGFANGSGFVGWQVIQDDGVAGHELWGQDLLDISEEGGTVHGPVDGHGRHHAIKCQAANKGRRLPMAMRNRGAAALASRCATILSGHLGRCAAFIDKNEARRVEIGLGFEPSLTLQCYVRTILLGSVRCLFLRVTPRRLKNSCTTLGGGR